MSVVCRIHRFRELELINWNFEIAPLTSVPDSHIIGMTEPRMHLHRTGSVDISWQQPGLANPQPPPHPQPQPHQPPQEHETLARPTSRRSTKLRASPTQSRRGGASSDGGAIKYDAPGSRPGRPDTERKYDALHKAFEKQV